MLAEGGGLDLERTRELITERVPAVPRLRQRLLSVPPGCGGPIRIDPWPARTLDRDDQAA